MARATVPSRGIETVRQTMRPAPPREPITQNFHPAPPPTREPITQNYHPAPAPPPATHPTPAPVQPFLTPAQQAALDAIDARYANSMAGDQRKVADAVANTNQGLANSAHTRLVGAANTDQTTAARGLFQSSIRAGDLNDLDAAMVMRNNLLNSNLNRLTLDTNSAMGLLTTNWTNEHNLYNSLAAQNAASQTPVVPGNQGSGGGTTQNPTTPPPNEPVTQNFNPAPTPATNTPGAGNTVRMADGRLYTITYDGQGHIHFTPVTVTNGPPAPINAVTHTMVPGPAGANVAHSGIHTASDTTATREPITQNYHQAPPVHIGPIGPTRPTQTTPTLGSLPAGSSLLPSGVHLLPTPNANLGLGNPVVQTSAGAYAITPTGAESLGPPGYTPNTPNYNLPSLNQVRQFIEAGFRQGSQGFVDPTTGLFASGPWQGLSYNQALDAATARMMQGNPNTDNGAFYANAPAYVPGIADQQNTSAPGALQASGGQSQTPLPHPPSALIGGLPAPTTTGTPPINPVLTPLPHPPATPQSSGGAGLAPSGPIGGLPAPTTTGAPPINPGLTPPHPTPTTPGNGNVVQLANGQHYQIAYNPSGQIHFNPVPTPRASGGAGLASVAAGRASGH